MTHWQAQGLGQFVIIVNNTKIQQGQENFLLPIP